MILGLCLLMALLGCAVAAVATRPSGRDDDRRLRRVFRNPELVTLPDVENLLIAEGVPADAAARALRRAERKRISARTMWRWADRHGAGRLVEALDAGLSEDTLLDHLDAGTTPEWRSIAVFAELANETLPAFEDLTFPGLDDWTTEPDAELDGFDDLPPIADPAFGPFSAAEALEVEAQAEPAEEAPRDKKEDGEGDGWSAVA